MTAACPPGQPWPSAAGWSAHRPLWSASIALSAAHHLPTIATLAGLRWPGPSAEVAVRCWSAIRCLCPVLPVRQRFAAFSGTRFRIMAGAPTASKDWTTRRIIVRALCRSCRIEIPSQAVVSSVQSRAVIAAVTQNTPGWADQEGRLHESEIDFSEPQKSSNPGPLGRRDRAGGSRGTRQSTDVNGGIPRPQ